MRFPAVTRRFDQAFWSPRRSGASPVGLLVTDGCPVPSARRPTASRGGLAGVLHQPEHPPSSTTTAAACLFRPPPGWRAGRPGSLPAARRTVGERARRQAAAVRPGTPSPTRFAPTQGTRVEVVVPVGRDPAVGHVRQTLRPGTGQQPAGRGCQGKPSHLLRPGTIRTSARRPFGMNALLPQTMHLCSSRLKACSSSCRISCSPRLKQCAQ